MTQTTNTIFMPLTLDDISRLGLLRDFALADLQAGILAGLQDGLNEGLEGEYTIDTNQPDYTGATIHEITNDEDLESIGTDDMRDEPVVEASSHTNDPENNTNQVELSVQEDDLDLQSDDEITESDIENDAEDKTVVEKEEIPQPLPKPVQQKVTERTPITLNVGGERFHFVKKEELDMINFIQLNYARLLKSTNVSGETIHFLDRDYSYFKRLLELIGRIGMNRENVKSYMMQNLEHLSEPMILDMCFYGFLVKEEAIKKTPIIRLKKAVGFIPRPGNKNPGHLDIITLLVHGETFETTTSTLGKSGFFEKKLSIKKASTFDLSSLLINKKPIEAALFRYFLNFLRTGELYSANKDLIKMLEFFGVDFIREGAKSTTAFTETSRPINSVKSTAIKNTRITRNDIPTESKEPEHVVPHLEKVPGIGSLYQTAMSAKMANIEPLKAVVCDIMDSEENLTMYLGSTSVNIIDIDTDLCKLSFGTTLYYTITQKEFVGDYVDDLLLSVDLPVLDGKDKYIDHLGYRLIKSVNIIIQNDKGVMAASNVDGEYLYYHPVLYTDHKTQYHKMCSINEKRTSVLYGNELINIHRINIPLFLLMEPFPLHKYQKENGKVIVEVKLNNQNDFIMTTPGKKTPVIPLLRAVLTGTFSNRPYAHPTSNKLQLCLLTKRNKYIVPINQEAELVVGVNPPRVHRSADDIISTTIISLQDNLFIRDMFLVINADMDILGKPMDILIDVNVGYQVKGQGMIMSGHLDGSLMNLYFPMTYLGRCLPEGVYYYSFSTDPNNKKIMGGLPGESAFLRIRTRKVQAYIKLFVNNYQQVLI